MKTSKGLVIATSTAICLIFASTPAWSGSKQQHRWEGVAIGIGAALVGSALINHHHAPVTLAYAYRHPGHNRHGGHHPGAWQRYRWGAYSHGYQHRGGSWSGKWHPGRDRHEFRRGHRGHNNHRQSYDRHGSGSRGREYPGRSGHGRGHH